MSIKLKPSNQMPVMVYAGFTCDKCKKSFDGDDFVQEQEGIFLSDIGGYGSIWGDGYSWSLSLCQECAYELFNEYVVYGD